LPERASFQKFIKQLPHIVPNLLPKPLKFFVGGMRPHKQLINFDVQSVGDPFYKV
jgi:hypothetical protein